MKYFDLNKRAQNGKEKNGAPSNLEPESAGQDIDIPVVYEKLQLNPGVPFVVQFGLFVQTGVFWHIIIGTIGSAL